MIKSIKVNFNYFNYNIISQLIIVNKHHMKTNLDCEVVLYLVDIGLVLLQFIRTSFIKYYLRTLTKYGYNVNS